VKVPPFELSTAQMRHELDRIRHPFRVAVVRAKNGFNVGAIVRTAHSFLAREIILVGTEPWYERAAMGMQRYEHLRELPDEATFLAAARAEAWKLVVFEREPARRGLWECALPEDAVLVFGNEDTGVPPAIVAAAHEVVAIPMFGINHSYPVTVAAGIAMAEWARRRYAGLGRVVLTPRSVETAPGTAAPGTTDVQSGSDDGEAARTPRNRG
jgi:tRNA G18 (ribose-2'-O)-methylase SpoU